MPDNVPSLDAFSPHEREVIRRAFGQHFGSFPPISGGIFLRTWRSGSEAGRPKLPPAVQTMLARGLVEIRQDRSMYRAFFTKAGLTALRTLAENRRFLDPIRFAHMRQELGLQDGDGS